LIYPAFLITAGAALALIMVTYLLPKLATLLTGTGKEPPFMIKASLGLSALLKSYWWALLVFWRWHGDPLRCAQDTCVSILVAPSHDRPPWHSRHQPLTV
jgi:hypothetical protein